MAADDTDVVVTLRANLKDYEAALKTAVRTTEKAAQAMSAAVKDAGKSGGGRIGGQMEADFRKTSKAIISEARSMQSQLGTIFKGLAAGVFAGFSVRGGKELLDANTKIQNSLKQTGIEGAKLARVYDRLGDIATANGGDFVALAQLYQRLTLASDSLGASSEEVLAFTNRLSLAIRASGVGGSEASAGIQQFTQAMQSGTLQGDELRSILENLPPVARAIAKGMGVSVGALRALGKEGKLTSREVFDAFMKGSQDMVAQAENAALTIDQAWSAIGTASIRLAGKLDELWGVSKKAGAVLNIIAEALERTAKADVKIDPDVSQSFGGIIDQVQALSGAIEQMEDHQGGKLLAADYKYLLQVLSDGTAVVTDFDGAIADARQDGSELGETIAKSLETAKAAFAASQAELDRLKDKAKETTEQITALDAALKLVGGNDLATLVNAMRMLSGLIPNLTNLPHDIATALINLPSTLGTILPDAVTATPSAAKEFLKTRAASAKVAERIDEYDDAYATALAKVLVLLPHAKVLSGPRTTAEQAEIRARHERMPGGVDAHPAARPGHSKHEQRGDERPQAADITGVSAAELQRAVDQVSGLETGRGFNDPMHVQLEQSAAAAKEASTAFDELFASNQKLLEQRLTSNEINSDYTLSEDQQTAALQKQKAAVEEANFAEQLLAAAKQQGLAITPALTAQINEQAHAMAAAGLAAEQLATSQRTAAKAAQEQAQAAQQFSQQIAGMAQSAIGGLVNDLRNGVEAGEAFNNMLNRIIDSLIQMALQSLFSPAGGGGLLSMLFGGMEKGGIVGSGGPKVRRSPLVFAGAPRFAAGGMVGLKPGEVPIIAHRGEMVIPKNMVGRGGTRMGNVTYNIGGIGVSVNTGPDRVVANSDDGKKLGLMIDRAAQAVIVRESRPGGLLRRVG